VPVKEYPTFNALPSLTINGAKKASICLLHVIYELVAPSNKSDDYIVYNWYGRRSRMPDRHLDIHTVVLGSNCIDRRRKIGHRQHLGSYSCYFHMIAVLLRTTLR
jgi:hypothetical protein